LAVQVTGAYGTGGTSAGGIGPTYTYINKKTLEYAKPSMPIHQFVQKKLIPLQSGKTARFTRLMHLLPVTSAGTEGAALTTLKPYAMHFDVTVAEWENAIAVATLLDDTFITPALEAYLEILGINMGESMNLELQKTLWGEDYDQTTNTYQADVGCIGFLGDATTTDWGKWNLNWSAATSGSTTTFITAASNNDKVGGAYNDDLIGGSIVFTNPVSQNYGLGRRIFDYASSAPTVTWKTAVKVTTQANAPATTPATADYCDTARLMCHGTAEGGTGAATALTSGTDIMKANLIRRAVGILRKEMARPIRGADFVAILGPESYHNLAEQTGSGEYIDIHKYDNHEQLLGAEVGRIAGCRIIFDNKPYKLSATTPFDYSATGGLHVSFVLGRNALGACGLQGQNTLGQEDTQVIIKRPGPETTSDPTNKFSTAGWKTTFARLSLNACHAVGIVTYPATL